MRNKIILSSSILLLIVISFLTLMLGSKNLSFIDVINSLISQDNTQIGVIINNIRLPRLITGLMSGATLALSGLLLKTVLKNPLADASIIGVSSGASLAVVIIILLLPNFFAFIPLFAFVGGFLAFLLVLALSTKNGNVDRVRMVLAGVAVNSLFQGVLSIINSLNKDKIQYTISYLGGSIANISMDTAITISIYSIIAIAITIYIFPIIKLARLDDNMMTNIGKNPSVIRLLISVVAVFLASISVSFIGVIGFAGIIAPFFAFKLIKEFNLYYLIETLVVGALLVLGSDLAQRIIFDPMEIPVGVVIGLLGAPLFLYFIKNELN